MSQNTGGTGEAGAWTGARINNLRFNRRMRGYDESEVERTLEAVARHIDGQARQIEWHQAEISRLQHNVWQLQTNDDIKQKAIDLLNQAQELADQLVDEAVQHTRDLMMAGRAQAREIARTAADATSANSTGAKRATAVADHGSDRVVEVSPDTNLALMHAHVSATQLRAVVDALSEHIDKLSELAAPAQRANTR